MDICGNFNDLIVFLVFLVNLFKACNIDLWNND